MLLPNRFGLWILLATSMIMAGSVAGIRLAPALTVTMLGLLIFLIGLEYFFLHRKAMRFARMIFSFVVIVIVGWTAFAIHASLLRLGLPEIDPILLAIDRAFGFDWLAWNATLSTMPIVELVLQLAYASLITQILLIVILLSKERREQDLIAFLNAYGVALIATTLIAGFLPAHAVCRTFGLEYSLDPELQAQAACRFLPIYDGLRNGTLVHLRYADVDGLATFPSFHTTAAILFIWAVRKIKRAAPLFVALNLAMVAATPTIGGHYLIDLFAGTAMAMFGIAIAHGCASKFRSIFQQPAPSFASSIGNSPP